MYSTSVILPVYNESESIERTVSSLLVYAKQHPDYYFLFVNDGSTDRTPEYIRTNIQGVPNIELLDLKKNAGKAQAVKAAVKEVDTDYVVFNDGDMAYSFEHIDVVVDALKTYDVAIGNRKLGENRPRKIQRLVAGEAFNRLARFMLSLPYTDTQAGIKGFRKEAAKKLFKLSRIDSFAFDAELIYIAKLKGYKIVPVPAKVNSFHSYNPSTIKVLRDSPGMFLSLLQILINRLRGCYNE